MKKLGFNSILPALAVLLICRVCLATDLGRDGATYPIAEPDALAEMEARARTLDWNKVVSRKKTAAAVRQYRPEGVKPLSRAKNDRSFRVDMTYTLEMDIPDGKGGILYPKGFMFNPLDYMPVYPFTLVVIDGNDPMQIEWLKRSPYIKDTAAKLLLVGGSAMDLSEELGRPVFYILPRMLERLRLSATPSVVRQVEKKMDVKEVAVEAALVKMERP